MHHIKNEITGSLLLSSILAPFLTATLTYFVFGRLDDLKKEKRQSRLGASVLQTLEEEVKNGLKEMQRVFDMQDGSVPDNVLSFLPNKSWLGINTINDDVLIRILEVTKNVKMTGFPPSEIRIHTKNYFDMMVANWNDAISAKWHFTDIKRIYEKYPEAAQGVLNMLVNTRQLLEKDANRNVLKDFLNVFK